MNFEREIDRHIEDVDYEEPDGEDQLWDDERETFWSDTYDDMDRS